MTQEEVRNILEKSGKVIPHFDEEDQVTYAVKIGKFYREYEESFSFGSGEFRQLTKLK
jgi:hypothetical protein